MDGGGGWHRKIETHTHTHTHTHTQTCKLHCSPCARFPKVKRVVGTYRESVIGDCVQPSIFGEDELACVWIHLEILHALVCVPADHGVGDLSCWNLLHSKNSQLTLTF